MWEGGPTTDRMAVGEIRLPTEYRTLNTYFPQT